MIIKAIRPDNTHVDLEIPDSHAEKYERDIEVKIPEGLYPRIKTIEVWCRKVGIKCVEV